MIIYVTRFLYLPMKKSKYRVQIFCENHPFIVITLIFSYPSLKLITQEQGLNLWTAFSINTNYKNKYAFYRSHLQSLKYWIINEQLQFIIITLNSCLRRTLRRRSHESIYIWKISKEPA